MDVERPTWGSTLVKKYDGNKTYILVRLSESFSNAIEEYSTSPTIKFHGTRGAIRFPNGKSYDFSLRVSDHAVECVKQTKTRWESVGKMACCLHVKGKDDVYERTRTKMEAAEQEKRKYCTKLLGSPDDDEAEDERQETENTIQNNININNNNNNNNNQSTQINDNHPKYHQFTDNQLKRYKADFDKDYPEYLKLHGYLKRIEERFKKLKELLKQNVEGSAEYESVKEQIFTEYERFESDSNFHKARSKYKQLRDKLTHVKERILEHKRQQKLRDGRPEPTSRSAAKAAASATTTTSMAPVAAPPTSGGGARYNNSQSHSISPKRRCPAFDR